MTHVVAPELRRAVKTLAAFAAGVWVLRTSFLDASGRARALVEPVSSPGSHTHHPRGEDVFQRFMLS